MALATEADNAKILAFSYPELAEGIARVEHAKADLTAIVEDGLDEKDDGTQFALETLRRSSIHVAAVSELPALAERARVELKL
jgi:hypothetical protein